MLRYLGKAQNYHPAQDVLIFAQCSLSAGNRDRR